MEDELRSYLHDMFVLLADVLPVSRASSYFSFFNRPGVNKHQTSSAQNRFELGLLLMPQVRTGRAGG